MSESTLTEDLSHDLGARVAGRIVDAYKALRKPWDIMTHAEQKEICDQAAIIAGDVIREAVTTIAAEDRKIIMAKLKKVAVTDNGYEAALVANRHSEYRHELADAQGMDVLIVVADAGQYLEGAVPEAEAPKDGQPGMFDDNDTPVADNTRAAAE